MDNSNVGCVESGVECGELSCGGAGLCSYVPDVIGKSLPVIAPIDGGSGASRREGRAETKCGECVCGERVCVYAAREWLCWVVCIAASRVLQTASSRTCCCCGQLLHSVGQLSSSSSLSLLWPVLCPFCCRCWYVRLLLYCESVFVSGSQHRVLCIFSLCPFAFGLSPLVTASLRSPCELRREAAILTALCFAVLYSSMLGTSSSTTAERCSKRSH